MRDIQVRFAMVSAIICAVFITLVNYLTSPEYIWFYSPVFAVFWWPLGVYLKRTGKIKNFSIIGSLLTFSMLLTINLIHTPDFFWILFTLPVLIWWPVSIIVASKFKTFAYAMISFFVISSSYIILNIVMAPAHPWAIYIIYAMIWWPLSVGCAKKKRSLGIAVFGTIISIVFFSAVNYVVSPDFIWAVYPIFALLWWPLSVYYFNTKLEGGYARSHS